MRRRQHNQYPTGRTRAAASSAGRATEGNEFFPAERDGAVAAVSGFHAKFAFIYEVHCAAPIAQIGGQRVRFVGRLVLP